MPLVTRNHPKRTAEGARAVLTTAQRRASEIRCPMNIAAVDEGAHLLLFERMDGAKPSSIAIALVKAKSVFVYRFAVYTGSDSIDATLVRLKSNVAALYKAN